MNFSKLTRRAFTLVEVLLALFVFTFGLLGLLGVMAGLLKSVSVIEEKHQTADLAALLQDALRYEPAANDTAPKKPIAFEDTYKALMAKPRVFLTYIVQTDPTKVETRQTKIIPVQNGISEADLSNLTGPIAKIFAQASVSYRSVSIPSSTGSVTKVTKWVADPTQSPDPYLTVDAYVYIIERPALPSDLDSSERHPDNLRPARRFSITLPR